MFKDKTSWHRIIFVVTIVLLSTLVLFIAWKNTQIVEKKIFNDNKELCYHIIYNPHTQTTTHQYYEEETIRREQINNKEGKLLQEKLFSATGELKNTTLFFYNEKKLLIKKEIYNENDILLFITDYFYDNEQKISQTTYHDILNNAKTDNYMNKNSVRQIMYQNNAIISDFNDTTSDQVINKYSDKGIILYSYQINKTSHTIKEMLFNHYGNKQSEKEYSSKGYLMYEKFYETNGLVTHTTYQYNNKGFVIQKNELNDDATVKRKYLYEYNAKGNRIRINIFDEKGNKIDYF